MENAVQEQPAHQDDAAELLRFARSLPPGSLLRHHVVGDLGLAA